ncbi:MAG: sulfotransferase [Myxococcota bacterium]
MYVVLGMHKSGTTLVSRMLHESGIEMIQPGLDRSQTDYDEGAYFERERVIDLNRDLLGFGQPAHRYPKPRRLEASEDQRTEMRRILGDAEPEEGVDWGIKEPRLCLTYPLWEPEMPEHRVIAVYRELPEVWSHYKTRYSPRREIWWAVRAWSDYNEGVLSVLDEGKRDAIVIQYERLMTEQREFDRLAEFIGRPLSDMRKPDKYRSRSMGARALAAVELTRRACGLSAPSRIAERLHAHRRRQYSA